MLWLYAEQARFYSAPGSRRYHDGFAQAGGTGALQVFPAFGGDGHRLVDRVEIWSAPAAEFLRAWTSRRRSVAQRFGDHL